MILSTDLILRHPLWERADLELCSNNGLGIFNRIVDVYVLACAIGIKKDKAITDGEESETIVRTIGRNTYMSATNTDLKMLLDFMLQNALIHSQLINFDMDERLKLAFNPDYTTPKLSAAGFLNGFANYGLEKIFEKVKSGSSLITITDLFSYFNSLSTTNIEDILENIILGEIGRN